MVKGISQNVIPYSDGWAVYEDWQPDTLRFFSEQDEAMRYARKRSHYCETPVLLYSAAPCEPERITLLIMSGGSLSSINRC